MAKDRKKDRHLLSSVTSAYENAVGRSDPKDGDRVLRTLMEFLKPEMNIWRNGNRFYGGLASTIMHYAQSVSKVTGRGIDEVGDDIWALIIARTLDALNALDPAELDAKLEAYEKNPSKHPLVDKAHLYQTAMYSKRNVVTWSLNENSPEHLRTVAVPEGMGADGNTLENYNHSSYAKHYQAYIPGAMKVIEENVTNRRQRDFLLMLVEYGEGYTKFHGGDEGGRMEQKVFTRKLNKGIKTITNLRTKEKAKEWGDLLRVLMEEEKWSRI